METAPDPRDQCAANYARSVARNPASPDYRLLSSKMCWDAVLECAVKVQIITEEQCKRISGKTALVNGSDRLVTSAESMKVAPPGQSLGFFAGFYPMHMMLSTGGGKGAGNKNACIGIGQPVGWELLDLVNGPNWEYRTALSRYQGAIVSLRGIHIPTGEVAVVRRRSLSLLDR